MNTNRSDPAQRQERQARRQARQAAQAARVEPGTEPQALADEAIIRPFVSRAQVRPRHRAVFYSLFLIVVVPTMALAVYLFVFAQDQFASNTGFTVRNEQGPTAASVMGGLSAIVGGGSSSDTDVLYAFIHSQQMVERMQEEIDLRSYYSVNWSRDPLFSLWPDATIEDLVWFWNRVITVSYDQNSGLMELQVRAYTPEMAQRIGRLIVSESETMINALNTQARSDRMANAQSDLDDALARLRTAREDLASFRARTQIIDPQADISGRMGVINGLQQQLAQALVEYDLLLQTTTDSDPRARQAERRIEVIRQRISEERHNFATQDATVFDTDYPRLIAQFEGLTVNQHFAEATYTAALAAHDAARTSAERQTLYLATFVQPTLSERAEYPSRFVMLGLTIFFLTLAWGAIILIYYSLRDRG